MGPGYDITSLIVALLIFIVFIFITRELWCWYLKINKLVEEQQKQNQYLRTQIDILSLIALKNGVPDKKILQAINRKSNEKIAAREWIEENIKKREEQESFN